MPKGLQRFTTETAFRALFGAGSGMAPDEPVDDLVKKFRPAITLGRELHRLSAQMKAGILQATQAFCAAFQDIAPYHVPTMPVPLGVRLGKSSGQANSQAIFLDVRPSKHGFGIGATSFHELVHHRKMQAVGNGTYPFAGTLDEAFTESLAAHAWTREFSGYGGDGDFERFTLHVLRELAGEEVLTQSAYAQGFQRLARMMLTADEAEVEAFRAVVSRLEGLGMYDGRDDRMRDVPVLRVQTIDGDVRIYQPPSATSQSSVGRTVGTLSMLLGIGAMVGAGAGLAGWSGRSEPDLESPRPTWDRGGALTSAAAEAASRPAR